MLGDAVAIGVAQQRDAVGARHAGACALHHELHHPVPQAAPVVGPVGVAFSATSTSPLGRTSSSKRVVSESRGETLHGGALCRHRHRVAGPAWQGR